MWGARQRQRGQGCDTRGMRGRAGWRGSSAYATHVKCVCGGGGLDNKTHTRDARLDPVHAREGRRAYLVTQQHRSGHKGACVVVPAATRPSAEQPRLRLNG
eukprot:scaffold35780_cov61-Phaeocystis_antarctica.AAC.3